MPRNRLTIGDASVGTMVRAITRPLSSRTVVTVVAWWTSSPTYLVDRFMRAAPCRDPWDFDNSMVAVRGVLSISVRQATSQIRDGQTGRDGPSILQLRRTSDLCADRNHLFVVRRALKPLL